MDTSLNHGVLPPGTEAAHLYILDVQEQQMEKEGCLDLPLLA